MIWIDGFGNMPHDNRHTLVTELAEGVRGVKSVDNQMNIKG